MEPQFLEQWQRYRDALAQRNAALRSGGPRATVGAWDASLAGAGEALAAARGRYVERFAPVAAALGERLLGLELSLSYRRGWPPSQTLSEALIRTAEQGVELGRTPVGPHRAELALRVAGALAKDRISRGQQKLLAAALLLAQLELFPEESAVRPTLLLDDPAAELDDLRLEALISTVRQAGVQLVVTTLHPEFAALGRPGRRFRLARGQVEAD